MIKALALGSHSPRAFESANLESEYELPNDEALGSLPKKTAIDKYNCWPNDEALGIH